MSSFLDDFVAFLMHFFEFVFEALSVVADAESR